MRIRRTLILKFVAVIACLGICLFALAVSAGTRPANGPVCYSIVPPLLAVGLALLTNRMRLGLLAAVLAGGLLIVLDDSVGSLPWLTRGLHQAGTLICHTVWHPDRNTMNADNVRILLYVVLIMAMISVMLVAGGLQGVARWLEKHARSSRSTQLVTMALGLVVFIDDYANTMIVGSTMRPVTDRQRISREKLAFIVDATAAPVAGIAILSTWIGYEVGLLSETALSLGVPKDGYEIFFDAIGFRFYCIVMIAFVFFNAFSGQDFGPMAKAQRRARREGKLLDRGASPMMSDALASVQPHPIARVSAPVAIVPMLTVLAVFLGGLWFGGRPDTARGDPLAILSLSAWRDALDKADSVLLLVYASLSGLLLAIVLARIVARVPWLSIAKAVALGVKSSILPVTVLVLAWSLKGACDELQTGEFLADALAETLSPWVLPALVFVVAGLTSFATGTSWGTMAILIPTAVPVAFHLDGEVYGPLTVISVAAVLDGAIFGDHCSPISDTTIMSSTGSSCDHLAHVRTQIPYSLCVAGLALGLGYVPAALGVSSGFSILAAIALLGLLFLGLKLGRRIPD